MADVVLYTTRICPYCVAARRLFHQKGVAFREVDVSGDPEKRRWLVEVTGRRTIPQIFIDGRPYGGFTDVAALDRRGELDPLLTASGAA
jgi:glutaredoxin 3